MNDKQNIGNINYCLLKSNIFSKNKENMEMNFYGKALIIKKKPQILQKKSGASTNNRTIEKEQLSGLNAAIDNLTAVGQSSEQLRLRIIKKRK